MKQLDRVRISRERYARMLRQREMGLTVREIAEVEDISRTRVYEIFKQGKKREENRSQLVDELGMRIVKVLKRILEIEKPTLIDLSRFIRKNPDIWKDIVLMTRGGGQGTVDEIEKFAKRNGIL